MAEIIAFGSKQDKAFMATEVRCTLCGDLKDRLALHMANDLDGIYICKTCNEPRHRKIRVVGLNLRTTKDVICLWCAEIKPKKEMRTSGRYGNLNLGYCKKCFHPKCRVFKVAKSFFKRIDEGQCLVCHQIKHKDVMFSSVIHENRRVGYCNSCFIGEEV